MPGVNNMITVADVITQLGRIAPPSLAASWDNVGLLLGDRKSAVQKVLTCLTLTEAVAEEAIKSGVQLIVTHHPILFRGAKRLTADTSEGRMILSLARVGISVFSPHTCFDDGPSGINDQLAAVFQLNDVGPLRTSVPEECKFVVFVPENDLPKVSDAIFAAGAGVIGQYHECSFRLAGTGTFFGSEAANPAVGQKGHREEVAEIRLEAVCPKSKVEAIVAAMRSTHSYEEPAYDVYPLVGVGGRVGAGRVGMLANAVSLREFAAIVKRRLTASIVQVVGNPSRIVQRIAIACGAAGEFLDDARRAKADVFVTGEMRFHDYLAAEAAGLGLVLPGHYATERFAVAALADWINTNVPGVNASVSNVEKDPVTLV